jgi:hypothetical protein
MDRYTDTVSTIHSTDMLRRELPAGSGLPPLAGPAARPGVTVCLVRAMIQNAYEVLKL